MDPSGVQDAFTVLLPPFRKGLTVFPLPSPIDFFPVYVGLQWHFSFCNVIASDFPCVQRVQRLFLSTTRVPVTCNAGDFYSYSGVFLACQSLHCRCLVQKELPLMFRLCAKSRTCSCWGPFVSQLCPARVSMHSPRFLNQLWRHRICDLVIRYRRTYVFLTYWWTRMAGVGGWKINVWKIPMAFVRWHLVVRLVYLNRWNMVDSEDSSRKRSFLYVQQIYFPTNF